MKGKPVYKNVGKGRMQIIVQGVPVWLEPGECVVGERFKAYEKMGLVEVGRDGLPAKPKLAAPKAALNDPAPEKSPIKVRKIQITDAIMPRDDIKLGSGSPKKKEPEPEPAPEAEPEEPMSGVSGEALKDLILADLGSDPDALDISEGDDILVLIDEEEEEEDPLPVKCPECGKGFASKRGLKSHSRIHK